MAFFELLGYLFLVVFSFSIFRRILSGIFSTFLAPYLGLGVKWEKLGKWAVVTGGTDGIGKAYAEQLAKKGFNIVLISRSQDKLDNVAQEIEKLAVVKTKTIAVDFALGSEIYEGIKKGLEGLEIGVLVNNVGISYDYPEYHVLLPDGEKMIKDTLNVNMLSCSMMMHLVLPGMVERKNGVIINVASLSAAQRTPFLLFYSSSKAYMDYLSQTAQAEYKDIIIQSVLPGFVVTKMSKLRKSTLIAPFPTDYVKWALKTVGIESRTAGHPIHKLLLAISELGGYFAPSAILNVTVKQLLTLRRAHYKKNKLEDPFGSSARSSKHD